MRYLGLLLDDGGIDLAEVNKEITSSVQANATATPDKPASIPTGVPSYRQGERDAMPPTTPDLVYRGGATTTPDLVYRGGATTQNLDIPSTFKTDSQKDAEERAKYRAGERGDGSATTTASTPTASTEDEFVTHWRSGIKAKKGTSLAALFEKQNADRADYDAAYAQKPTTPAPEGMQWTWQVRNRQWALVKLTGFGGTTTSTSTAGAGGKTESRREYLGSGASRVLRVYYSDGTFQDFAAPDTTGDGDGNNNQGGGNFVTKPTLTGQITRRKTGGIVQVVSLFSDGSEQVIDEYKDYSARDAVMKMFENTGLGQSFLDSLMKSIDQVYADNIAPTDAQILNSIYNSDAYKQRFAANEIIRKRMADGTDARPGDRLLTPAEYVKTEAAYRELMSEAGLPPGFYDQPEDFTKFIAELGTSVAEVSERINVAKRALQNADQNIKDSLKQYYGWTDNDLVAYLLDPERAFQAVNSRFTYTTEALKERYGVAEVGGAATRAGMTGGVSETFAKEIFKAGKADLAERAFQQSAREQKDYQRLMGLYGEQAGTEDLAREALALAGGADIGIKTKKLASKERAKFQQRSAIDKASLGSRLRNPDV